MERVTVRHIIIILKVHNSQISNKIDAKRKNTEKEHEVWRERATETEVSYSMQQVNNMTNNVCTKLNECFDPSTESVTAYGLEFEQVLRSHLLCYIITSAFSYW